MKKFLTLTLFVWALNAFAYIDILNPYGLERSIPYTTPWSQRFLTNTSDPTTSWSQSLLAAYNATNTLDNGSLVRTGNVASVNLFGQFTGSVWSTNSTTYFGNTNSYIAPVSLAFICGSPNVGAPPSLYTNYIQVTPTAIVYKTSAGNYLIMAMAQLYSDYNGSSWLIQSDGKGNFTSVTNTATAFIGGSFTGVGSGLYNLTWSAITNPPSFQPASSSLTNWANTSINSFQPANPNLTNWAGVNPSSYVTAGSLAGQVNSAFAVITNGIAIQTNYNNGVNFAPIPGFLKIVSSNNVLYTVTMTKTNPIGTNPFQ